MNGRAGADRRGRKHARGDYLASPLAPESNRMEARRIAVRKREDWDSATRPPAVRAENELGFVWGALLRVGFWLAASSQWRRLARRGRDWESHSRSWRRAAPPLAHSPPRGPGGGSRSICGCGTREPEWDRCKESLMGGRETCVHWLTWPPVSVRDWDWDGNGRRPGLLSPAYLVFDYSHGWFCVGVVYFIHVIVHYYILWFTMIGLITVGL
jgi:hypothetical protein